MHEPSPQQSIIDKLLSYSVVLTLLHSTEKEDCTIMLWKYIRLRFYNSLMKTHLHSGGKKSPWKISYSSCTDAWYTDKWNNTSNSSNFFTQNRRSARLISNWMDGWRLLVSFQTCQLQLTFFYPFISHYRGCGGLILTPTRVISLITRIIIMRVY